MIEDCKSESNPEGAPEATREVRIGVYVCHCGGNISDVVDVEKVASAIGKLPGVVVSKTHMFMCSDPGQNLIVEDIKEHKLNRIVVASCTPSLHEVTFRTAAVRGGLNPYLYEHANIREQVSWCSKSDPEGATDKATRLVAAAVAKARLLEPLEPFRVEAKQHVLVIGGGVAGMRSALAAARRGFAVSLVEKADRLGGRVPELTRLYPVEGEGKALVDRLAGEINAEKNITVYTLTQVESISGAAGDFTVKLRSSGTNGREEIELHVGAVIVATGFDHYEPKKGEYGWGEFPEVITLPELIRILGETDGELRVNGRVVRNVALIHCVGSRQVEGVDEPGPNGKLNEYCSRVCCTAALRSACELRSRFPEINVFEFYRDIRTYGRGHEDYYEKASDLEVLFFRFLPEERPVVTRAEKGPAPLVVTVKDRLTFGEEVSVPADLVVLVTGMIPRAIEELIETLKLPRSADGFLQEVHPKLRPVEVSVEGVMIAGTCQGPMDIGESSSAGLAAAAKAAALLGEGYITLDPFKARVNVEACRGTGACVEACAYQKAISLVEIEVEGGVRKCAQVNPSLCTGCGMCVPVCTNRAIEVSGWKISQFEAMVEALVGEYEEQ